MHKCTVDRESGQGKGGRSGHEEKQHRHWTEHAFFVTTLHLKFKVLCCIHNLRKFSYRLIEIFWLCKFWPYEITIWKNMLFCWNLMENRPCSVDCARSFMRQHSLQLLNKHRLYQFFSIFYLVHTNIKFILCGCSITNIWGARASTTYFEVVQHLTSSGNVVA